jgi:hypothetical protein
LAGWDQLRGETLDCAPGQTGHALVKRARRMTPRPVTSGAGVDRQAPLQMSNTEPLRPLRLGVSTLRCIARRRAVAERADLDPGKPLRALGGLACELSAASREHTSVRLDTVLNCSRCRATFGSFLIRKAANVAQKLS